MALIFCRHSSFGPRISAPETTWARANKLPSRAARDFARESALLLGSVQRGGMGMCRHVSLDLIASDFVIRATSHGLSDLLRY